MSVVFVDTNIFVYRYDETEAEKQRTAEDWLEVLWSGRTGRTSMQVLHEAYVTLTRKLSRPLGQEDARTIVRSLEAWRPVESDPALVHAAWELEDSLSLSFWDAMIVAAAIRSNASILLTEDLQHGQAIESVTITNPFRSAPPADLVQDR